MTEDYPIKPDADPNNSPDEATTEPWVWDPIFKQVVPPDSIPCPFIQQANRSADYLPDDDSSEDADASTRQTDSGQSDDRDVIDAEYIPF